MEEDVYKEVYYDQYCKTCENKNVKENEEPCFSCLAEPTNLYSHKPVRYKRKEK